MAYGRPMKNTTRRIPITVHIPVGTLGVIDDYVREQTETSGTAYSRSDFYNEAVALLLQSKGIDPETGERTKSVPEKITVKPNEDNTNN